MLKFVTLASLTVLLIAGSVYAGAWPSAAIPVPNATATPLKLKSISGTIKGTMAAPTNGSCGVAYSNQCPGGTCKCVVYNGTLASSVGTSSNVVIDMTVDTSQSAGDGACDPFYAEVSLAASKDIAEDWDMAGTLCESFSGKFPVSGGWGLSDSNVFFPGVGTLTGTQDEFLHAGTFDFHFTGKGCTNC